MLELLENFWIDFSTSFVDFEEAWFKYLPRILGDSNNN
jgi:hypothetical protein